MQNIIKRDEYLNRIIDRCKFSERIGKTVKSR